MATMADLSVTTDLVGAEFLNATAAGPDGKVPG